MAAERFPTRSIPAALTRWTTSVERELRQAALPGGSLLGRMAAYHMGWIEADGRPARAEGKLVRSNLCCWAAEACGGAGEPALPAACAIELIHNFTLVHDDVQDGDEMRRGRPTVWSIWGAAQAINAGDGLCAMALRTLLGGPSEQEIDGPNRSRAGQVILEALIEVIDGQCLDLEHECRPDTPIAIYLRMVEAKTGALLGASLEAGAVMVGSEPRIRARLRRAGRLLGVAFQLRDDWLGVWGEPAITGKSRENDLARRKLSHPVVVAYQRADPRQREELQALYQSRGQEQEPRIRNLLCDLGGPELTAGDAVRYATDALAEIEGCGLAEARVQEFADVATYIAERIR